MPGDITLGYLIRMMANNLLPRSTQYGLTAKAGGGQSGATKITKNYTVFTTVASANDSALLPVAVVGNDLTVTNSGANAMQIYPFNTTDAINGLGAGNPYTLAAGATATFRGTQKGVWATATASGGTASLGFTPNDAVTANTSTSAATLSAADISGANIEKALRMTGALAAGAALTLPTVAALVAAIPNAAIGQAYKLRILNKSSGAFAWTVTTNTGWTLDGTMTIAQNTYRDFYVTLTSLTAATLAAVGTGTES